MISHEVLRTALFGLIGITGLGWAISAVSEAAVADVEEKVQVTPDSLDYGILPRGASTHLTMSVARTSDEAIDLVKVQADGLPMTFRVSTPKRLFVPINKETGELKAALPEKGGATIRALLNTGAMTAGAAKGNCILTFSDGTQKTIPIQVEVKERPQVPNNRRPPAPRNPDPVVPSGPPPRITSESMEHDYGLLLIGEGTDHTFKFKNEGEGVLHITGLRAQCNCTGRTLTTATETIEEEEIIARDRNRDVIKLQPGEEASLDIALETTKLSPTRPESPLVKTITLNTNDPENRTFQFKVQCELKSAIQAEPSRVRLPDVRRGESLIQKVLLSSDMIEDYVITGATCNEARGLRATVNKVTDGPAPKYELLVEITSEAAKGRIADSVMVQVDHPRVSTIQVPVYGNVISQIDFIGNQERGITRLDFGSMDGSEDVSLDLQIVNRDPSVPFKPATVELTTRNNPDYFSHEVIEEEAGVKYLVRLTVKKDIQERYFSGKIRVTSDHPDEKVRLIDFRGWIVRPQAAKPNVPIRNPNRPLGKSGNKEGEGGR